MNLAQEDKHRFRNFIIVSCAMTVVFIASGSPFPLYEVMRIELGLSTSDLALTAVAYFAAIVPALFLFGRISEYIGRKPATQIALVLALISMVVLLNVANIGLLLLARGLQGIASGLATSAIANFVLDFPPQRREWLTVAVVSGSPPVGISIGVLISAVVLEVDFHPMVAPFIFVGVILVVSIGLVMLVPETGMKRRGFVSSLWPTLEISRRARILITSSATVCTSTWSLAGFYQAFSATLVARSLESHSALFIVLFFASYVATTGLATPLTKFFPPRKGQLLGTGLFPLAIGGIVLGLFLNMVWILVLSGVIAGLCHSVAVTSSIQIVMDNVPVTERVGGISMIFCISYFGSAIISYVAGRLSIWMDLNNVVILYCGIAIFAFSITVIAQRTARLR